MSNNRKINIIPIHGSNLALVNDYSSGEPHLYLEVQGEFPDRHPVNFGFSYFQGLIRELCPRLITTMVNTPSWYSRTLNTLMQPYHDLHGDKVFLVDQDRIIKITA